MGISTTPVLYGRTDLRSGGYQQKGDLTRYFTNTISPIGGITLDDIENDVKYRHRQGFDPLGLKSDMSLPSIGRHRSVSGQERHLYNSGDDTYVSDGASVRTGDYGKFKKYTHMIDEELGDVHIRDLMEFCYPGKRNSC